MTIDCLNPASGQSPMGVIGIPEAISPNIAEDFARCQGWQTAEKPVAGATSIRLAAKADEDLVAGSLQVPWSGLVEIDGLPAVPLGPTFLRHLREGGIGVCLRTDTAYQVEVAPRFVEAVKRRYCDRKIDMDDLELIVHELTSNAVIHGNLGVRGGWEDSLDPLDVFGGAMERALSDPALSARRVQLSAASVPGGLEISVEDDGEGYDHLAVRAQAQAPIRLHGLALVEKLTTSLRIERSGRRIVVVIPAEDTPAPAIDLSRVHVLVVDDTRANRELLRALLSSMGVGRIEMAEDGAQGLEAIAREKPDLVLLDVMMPRMDGYEMCRRLRAAHPLTDLPVIFVTARTDPEDRALCFAAGGTDMVSKPISIAEVKARVGVQLHHRLVLAELNAYRERVRHELQLAQEAQLSLVPTRDEIAALSRQSGLIVDGVMEASSELGGDFWTVFAAGPEKLGLLVADFTGHGPAAAFNVFRLHLLLSRRPDRTSSPAALLAWLNRELKSVLPPGQFAAAFAGIIDRDKGTLTFAGAGSPLPVLCEGGKARFLDSSGPPLGAFADAEFEDVVEAMPPGAALLAYSDALVETEVNGTPVCDEATLLRWVEAVQPDACVAAAVLDRFHQQVERSPDDLTLVCVRRPSTG